MNLDKKIEEYSVKIEEYIKNDGKDTTGKNIEFKTIGASSGVYQQRESDKFMVRPRTTGGIFNLNEFEKIFELRQNYEGSNIRLTSRQDFQFHNILLRDTAKLMNELKEIDYYSIGTGGNTARNISASPLSGLYKDEEFDITVYANAAGKFLSEDETNLNLPRKFKVAFTSTSDDTGSASFADLGFFAFKENGVKKFRVVGGGGLGPKPKVSMELSESIDPEDTIYYVDAMKQFFSNEGDRKNRAKARLRHLRDKYGDVEFKERFSCYLEKSYEKDLSINNYISEDENCERVNKLNNNPETAEDIRNKIESIKTAKSHFIQETNKEGIFAVRVAPIGGWLELDLHRELLDFLKGLDYEPEMRLTPSQEILLRNIREKDIDKIKEILDKDIIDSDFSNSISCVGSGVCRTGICESSEALKEVAEKVNSLPEHLRKQSFRVHISGCPSSCAQHQIAPLSFSGRLIKNEDGEREEGFTLFLGGKLKDSKGEARLGEPRGTIRRKDLPDFIVKLIEFKYESGLELEEFVQQKEKEIVEVLEIINRRREESDKNIVWHSYSKNREDREKLLNQKSFVLWLTGLSGSGKSTIAYEIEKKLYEKKKLSYILDGDNLRHGLNSDLKFSDRDRKENIRRVGELAKSLVDAGVITICALVSPFREDRQRIRESLKSDYIEVYVKADLETCKSRDPKNLYKKAGDGEIKDFTGLSSPYEAPDHPEIILDTVQLTPEKAADSVLEYLEKRKLI